MPVRHLKRNIFRCYNCQACMKMIATTVMTLRWGGKTTSNAYKSNSDYNTILIEKLELAQQCNSAIQEELTQRLLMQMQLCVEDFGMHVSEIVVCVVQGQSYFLLILGGFFIWIYRTYQRKILGSMYVCVLMDSLMIILHLFTDIFYFCVTWMSSLSV